MQKGIRQATTNKKTNEINQLATICRNKLRQKAKSNGAQRFKLLKQKYTAYYNELNLVRAASCNDTERVEILLSSGVSANSTDTESRSALHVAVSKGYSRLVQMLLEHGADPNKRDFVQNTPLHLAACTHNFEIISMLVKANADVSCLDSHGRSPLQLASSKLQILQAGWRGGTIEMVRLKQEIQQVVDLLLSILMKDSRLTEKTSAEDVGNLELMKLSLDSDPADSLDHQLSRLLGDIEKFQI